MAQFDVHANKGALRDSIPYVVIVQSSLFDDYRRRVVVPLVRKSVAAGQPSALRARVNPVFKVRNTEVVLHPLDIVSVSVDQLGSRVGSLAEQGQAIADALDEVLTRSWG
ncbi:MAG TPA: CcdB family protein [Ramlibacter sp.]|uniref:CcdB family protein n=1 Tax=Ramlibacter sp. TaxID=1917967 RepID=UPI002CF10391|nr:CcdB family protein [Ramlibacter sp.]HVZ45116.1 CcdB family protein [Ramlibacter sp.]